MEGSIKMIWIVVLLAGWLPCYGSAGRDSQDDSLINMAKALVTCLANEDFAGASTSFDGTMKKALPASKLREVWHSIMVQAGPFKNQLGVREGKISLYDVVFVTCEFEKGILDAKVVFNNAKQITGLFFVPGQRPAQTASASGIPSYAKPDSFREVEVKVGDTPQALPGTLTMPKGKGLFPTVVLVHGSGPQDRDESVGCNKPFRDLAWGLASNGIAVLRYEKRSKAFPIQTAAMIHKLTVKEETIDDALAAVALLRKTGRVDASKIFVLGHSLGGMVVPRIGKLDRKIAGFIIMAGTTRPLEDVILEQLTYIYSLDGTVTDAEKSELNKLKKQVAKVKDPNLSASGPASALLFGASAKYWLDLRDYNPPEVAKQLSQPMLILQGGRDYQVTKADFAGWRRALSTRKNVTLKLYPKLNHLFIQGKGKSTPAEYEKSGHVAKSVINDISKWIERL